LKEYAEDVAELLFLIQTFDELVSGQTDADATH
jgi:hypothetical protein